MKVVCTPSPTQADALAGVALTLMHGGELPGVGRTGLQVPSEVRRHGLRPILRAWDLLALSLAVVAADQACLRAGSPDGWTREIDLRVALAEPDPWRPILPLLEASLRFLTGDIWCLALDGGGMPPLTKGFRRSAPTGDRVCLLSGGVDSLVGAIDLVAAGAHPIFVSQRAKGDSRRQSVFAHALGAALPHIQLSHATKPVGVSERTQRSRSMMFLAIAVLAATSLPQARDGETTDIVVPENGFISLNVPLTPLRLGSLSTRTTHPHFLSQMQAIFDVMGFRVRLVNPYQFATKGEMLVGCRDQAALKRFVFESTSCGRFARWNYQHCGRCFPCLVRRAAFGRWGNGDATTRGYRFGNLALPDRDHRDFDDVRAAAYAIHKVRRDGIEVWSAGSISEAQLGDTAPYVSLAERGLREIESFMAPFGVL